MHGQPHIRFTEMIIDSKYQLWASYMIENSYLTATGEWWVRVPYLLLVGHFVAELGLHYP